MIGAALASVLVFLESGLWASVLLLVAAVSFFQPGIPQEMVFVIFAAPISAVLAAAAFEHFCEYNGKLKCLRLCASLGAFIFLMHGPLLGQCLDSAIRLLENTEPAVRVAFYTTGCASIVYCAALSAIATILFPLLFELPVRWLSGAASIEPGIPWRAVRLLSGIFFVGITIQFLADLYTAELNPLSFPGGGP